MKTNKPDILLIRKYLNGELDSRAMYELERKAQDDPMLMDLLIGMETASEADDQFKLAEIDQLISKRVQVNKTKKMSSWKMWLAAASLILVFTLIFLWMSKVPKKEVIIQQQVSTKKTEQPKIVTLPPVKTELPASKLRIAKILKKSSPATVHPPVAPSAVIPMIKLKVDSTTQMLAGAVENDSRSLNEVTIGYGRRRKIEDTASLGNVKKNQVALNNALAGKIAGVKIDSENSLSEVVVFNNTPVATPKNQPVIGWKAYKKYLSENAFSIDGKRGTVKLAFVIDSFGRPTHIRILKGLSDDLDKKAIQLIINGSKWVGDKDDLNKEIKITVHFNLR